VSRQRDACLSCKADGVSDSVSDNAIKPKRFEKKGRGKGEEKSRGGKVGRQPVFSYLVFIPISLYLFIYLFI
jgi:hypothetical protein